MSDRPPSRPPLLQRSVEPPTRHHPGLAIVIAMVVAGMAATGAAVPLLLVLGARDLAVHPTGGAAIEISIRPGVMPAAEPPPELHLVEVLDGTSYLMIAPLPRSADGSAAELPPGTGEPRLIGSTDEPRGAVAMLTADPGTEAAWLGRDVVLDGGCRARVTELAVVAVMTGGTDYMSITDVSPRRADVAAALMRDGAPQLAAVLDGCAGRYAHRAERAAPVVPGAIEDDALFASARRRLLDSEAARAANVAWREAGHEGTWQADEYTEIETRAYRHPRTGITTVSVMATSDVGCGGANIHLWAIFEVSAGGAWRERLVTTASPLYTVEGALDLDGDGTLEWLGSADLGDRLVVSVASGEPVTRTRLEIPFFGCPC